MAQLRRGRGRATPCLGERRAAARLEPARLEPSRAPIRAVAWDVESKSLNFGEVYQTANIQTEQNMCQCAREQHHGHRCAGIEMLRKGQNISSISHHMYATTYYCRGTDKKYRTLRATTKKYATTFFTPRFCRQPRPPNARAPSKTSPIHLFSPLPQPPVIQVSPHVGAWKTKKRAPERARENGGGVLISCIAVVESL